MKRKLIRLLAAMFAVVLTVNAAVEYANAATDYSKYSNSKKSWYISRKDKHKASGGAASAKKLAKYNAYYYNNKAKDKVMYLCFDCGYDLGYTKGVLDVLKKHKVKATFFVTKQYVKTSSKLCKKMKKEGHMVGNHTMNHPSLPTLSADEIKEEVNGLADYFKEMTGYTLDPFIRPPMGQFSNRALKVLKDISYTSIFWSMAYADYDQNKQPGKAYVVENFKKYYHKGAITLTHITSSSNAEALDDVLTFLESKGYRFGLLDELEK